MEKGGGVRKENFLDPAHYQLVSVFVYMKVIMDTIYTEDKPTDPNWPSNLISVDRIKLITTNQVLVF